LKYEFKRIVSAKKTLIATHINRKETNNDKVIFRVNAAVDQKTNCRSKASMSRTEKKL
jgi:hypothetical protein